MGKYIELFGKNLEMFLTEMGMNDYEFAAKSKIARPQVTNLRNGNGNPRLDTMEKIAEALGKPLSDFFMDGIEKRREDVKNLWRNIFRKETISLRSGNRVSSSFLIFQLTKSQLLHRSNFYLPVSPYLY